MDFKNRKNYLILGIITFLTIFNLFSGRYIFGGINQGEVIPIHARLEDPNYLKNDYLTEVQTEYNVRSNFGYLIYATHQATFETIDYSLIYLFYYIILSALIYYGVYKIGSIFTTSTLAQLSILLIFALSPNISIGSVRLIERQLLSSTFAASAMVWSIYFLLKNNHKRFIATLAISTASHLLIGTLTAGILFPIFLIKNYRNDLRKTLLLSTLLIASLSIILVPHLPNLFADNHLDTEKVIFIISEFRNPHHYLPSTWQTDRHIIFFGAQVVAIILLTKLESNKLLRNSLLAIFAITNLTYLAGYLFVEIIPIPLIIKLQTFRISIMGDLLIKILITAYSFKLMDLLFKKYSEKNNHQALRYTLVAAAVLIVSATTLQKFEGNLEYELIKPGENEVEAFSWIRENTPEDVIIIAPVSHDDIRLQIDRAIIINYKQFLFKDEQVLEWYNRMTDLCGMEEPSCRGQECRSYCQDKFYQYNEGQFHYLKEKYSAQYILTSSNHQLDFKLLFKDENYSIYQIE